MMMSDHGFGGVSNCVLYPNCWLHERGFLRFRGRVSHGLSRLRNAIKLRAMAGPTVELLGWRDDAETAELYYALSAHLDVDKMLTEISVLERGNRWHALARLSLIPPITGAPTTAGNVTFRKFF